MYKEGRYGLFYDRSSLTKEEKNKTRARHLSDEDAIEMAIEKLRRDRRLSINAVHSLLPDFAPEYRSGSTRVSNLVCTPQE